MWKIKVWQRAALLFLLFCSLTACYAFQRPQLEQYAKYQADLQQPIGRLNVTYLGTTTLYFNDGETGILIDGFFTRPDVPSLLGPIGPNKPLIKDYLQRLGIQKLAAIPVFHSHHDHAMDSSEIARLTGATLLGSSSTAMLAQGEGLPAAQMQVVEPGQAYHFGKFTIYMQPSRHVHLPSLIEATGMMGDITSPLVPPVPFYSYAEGETYSIVVAHPLGNSMLHSGAFWPGELAGLKGKLQIDTLFQCTPGLQRMPPQEQQQYYQEIIADMGVRRIVPVHWDDFTISLDQPLVALPRFAEDMEAAMDFLLQSSQQHPGLKIEFFPEWQTIALDR